MKIGIDASRAFGKERTGTEEYSYQLLRHLAVLPAASSHEVLLYVKEGAHVDLELPSNFTVREVRGNFLWTQFHLPLSFRKDHLDVLFVPAHTVPVFHPRKSVATVHGLEYKDQPACYSWKGRLLLDLNTRRSISYAGKIIVPSENTKKDLARYCQVAPEKISVIYHGAPLRKAEEKIKGQGGFNVLCVGRIERRKNLAAAVRAFGKFLDKIGETPGASGDEIRLILAGRRGFGWEEVRREITRSPYGKNIMEKGYVSHEEKDKLYADADVLLFPTLAEGFGLPVLEAMSYGVPVIASKIPVLTEVAGNGALLVEPTDEQGFADALWNIYASISAGEELVAKGYENLARFSWEKCAEETWKVLTEWG